MRDLVMGRRSFNDVDYFFRDEDQRVDTENWLVDHGFQKTRTTAHHTEFHGRVGSQPEPITVQCIHFAYYPTLLECIASFDWTICMFGFDGGEILMGNYAMIDLARKRLAVHRITYPVATMRRAIKYGNKGFTLCMGATASVLRETASNPQLLDPDHLLEYVD